jgi:hypothetical protein
VLLQGESEDVGDLLYEVLLVTLMYDLAGLVWGDIGLAPGGVCLRFRYCSFFV